MVLSCTYSYGKVVLIAKQSPEKQYKKIYSREPGVFLQDIDNLIGMKDVVSILTFGKKHYFNNNSYKIIISSYNNKKDE